MPADGEDEAAKKGDPLGKLDSNAAAEQQPRSWFDVPTPVKRIFDKFPLKTYDANQPPLRAPLHGQDHVLYLFASAQDARHGRPSYNPGCLKWQTYLKLCGINFKTAPSNNHASPSGSLPFLIPATRGLSALEPSDVVPSGKLQAWAIRQSQASKESPDVRYEAFMSLVDHNIRRAWLYYIYITPNFESIVVPTYIDQATSSPFVRLATAYELQTAASKELQKHSELLDADAIYNDVQDAFEALETLLDQDRWFFAEERPGLFDAAVFAYSHLLLRDVHGQAWKDARLRELLLTYPGLVQHQQRMYDSYYQE